MIPRIGQVALLSASLVMLAVGCQQQADEGPKPLSKEEAAKYRQVSIEVTGLT